MFAKWIFIAAAVLEPGLSDLPIMRQATAPVSDIRQRIAAANVEVQCPAVPPGVVAPPCVPQTVPVGFQVFCTAPGVWTVTVRMGLIAQETLGGKIWMGLPDGTEALLAAFTAAPGTPAYVGASLQAQALTYDSCYRIRVEANRPVELMADPRVSFITVGR